MAEPCALLFYSQCATQTALDSGDRFCLGGGTGRRKGLKIPRHSLLYEFDSRPRHHRKNVTVHLSCRCAIYIDPLRWSINRPASYSSAMRAGL